MGRCRLAAQHALLPVLHCNALEGLVAGDSACVALLLLVLVRRAPAPGRVWRLAVSAVVAAARTAAVVAPALLLVAPISTTRGLLLPRVLLPRLAPARPAAGALAVLRALPRSSAAPTLLVAPAKHRAIICLLPGRHARAPSRRRRANAGLALLPTLLRLGCSWRLLLLLRRLRLAGGLQLLE